MGLQGEEIGIQEGKGAGESLRLTLVKQSQESGQTESAGLAVTKRSCGDFRKDSGPQHGAS